MYTNLLKVLGSAPVPLKIREADRDLLLESPAWLAIRVHLAGRLTEAYKAIKNPKISVEDIAYLRVYIGALEEMFQCPDNVQIIHDDEVAETPPEVLLEFEKYERLISETTSKIIGLMQ